LHHRHLCRAVALRVHHVSAGKIDISIESNLRPSVHELMIYAVRAQARNRAGLRVESQHDSRIGKCCTVGSRGPDCVRGAGLKSETPPAERGKVSRNENEITAGQPLRWRDLAPL